MRCQPQQGRQTVRTALVDPGVADQGRDGGVAAGTRHVHVTVLTDAAGRRTPCNSPQRARL